MVYGWWLSFRIMLTHWQLFLARWKESARRLPRALGAYRDDRQARLLFAENENRLLRYELSLRRAGRLRRYGPLAVWTAAGAGCLFGLSYRMWVDMLAYPPADDASTIESSAAYDGRATALMDASQRPTSDAESLPSAPTVEFTIEQPLLHADRCREWWIITDGLSSGLCVGHPPRVSWPGLSDQEPLFAFRLCAHVE